METLSQVGSPALNRSNLNKKELSIVNNAPLLQGSIFFVPLIQQPVEYEKNFS